MANLFDSSELINARDQLLAGEIVAIPTETVYGLAASIESELGLKKIFAVKERPFFDPLIVHVASFKQAASLVREWPPLADYLARCFWPGPLTIVLPKSPAINSLITSGLDTVAIRYPAHPLAIDLINLVGIPLAAPSANKFGKTSPSQAAHVKAEFPELDLLILDGGECEIGLESTVIAVEEANSGNSVIKILRPGAVTIEMLQSALLKFSREVTIESQASAASPGHLEHHYMPKIPLIIVEDERNLDQLQWSDVSKRLTGRADTILSPREMHLDQDPLIAARKLYAEMRELSETANTDALFIRRTSQMSGGLWVAIWDRLSRAASLNLKSS